MFIDDRHISEYCRQGFTIVPSFLSSDEVAAALAGFHEIFAQDDKGARGVRQINPMQTLFPWDHSGLNHCATHPDIIDAAERIMGTREILLSDSDVNIRIPGVHYWDEFHVDHGNNTLGPVLAENNFNITFSLLLVDVESGMAPTRIVPWGKSDDEAIEFRGPAGSLLIYSTHTTRHAGSQFSNETGFRAAMWTMFCRKDRPWDCARPFRYKWSGNEKLPAYIRFIVESTPRRLELLGFPPLGNPRWTREFIDGMAERYPGFNTASYEKVLNTSAR